MKAKCSKIPFEGNAQIHVAMDEKGQVTHVSLNDLSKILKRTELMEEAARMCRSIRKFPVYGNGKLFPFIAVYEVHFLLKAVRGDSRPINRLCGELEAWAGKFLSQAGIQPETRISSPEKEPEITTLFFSGKAIGLKQVNGRQYFNATQMTHLFGKIPKDWLALSESKHFRKSLVQKGFFMNLESQLLTSRGSHGQTWMECRVALELARWLSLELYAWCISQAGVTDTGQELPVAATFGEAVQMALSMQEKLEESRHKIEFYDRFIENRDWFKTTIIADELGITAVQLNRFLMEMNVCRREKRQYVVHSAFSPLQCEIPYLWTNKYGKTYSFGKVRRWTKAGREYVIELWYSHNRETV